MTKPLATYNYSVNLSNKKQKKQVSALRKLFIKMLSIMKIHKVSFENIEQKC
jgi:hypothetical protein